MSVTPAKCMDRVLSPKNRWSYALWTILLFNCVGDSQKFHELASVQFWLFRALAVIFGLAWLITTLSRLREFGWSLAWVIPFTLPWLGLIWTFGFPAGGRSFGLAILAIWFVSQSFLILKNPRAPDGRKVEEIKA